MVNQRQEVRSFAVKSDGSNASDQALLLHFINELLFLHVMGKVDVHRVIGHDVLNDVYHVEITIHLLEIGCP